MLWPRQISRDESSKKKDIELHPISLCTYDIVMRTYDMFVRTYDMFVRTYAVSSAIRALSLSPDSLFSVSMVIFTLKGVYALEALDKYPVI